MGSEAGGALGELIREIEPAVMPVLEQEEPVDDVLYEAVCASVWYTMSRILERSSVIADAVVKGELLLKGAVYSLTTSQVTILKEEG